MSRVLHRAVLDGIRDAPAYQARGILVSPLLEATTDLAADETLLYHATYTLVRALPERLVSGSLLLISTMDVPGGVQFLWEGREPMRPGPATADVRSLLKAGPHGDLLDIALLALERFCRARAGFVETTVVPGAQATSFDRPPYVVRRVVAFLPTRPGQQEAAQAKREADSAAVPERQDDAARPDGFRAAARQGPQVMTQIRHA